MKPNSRLLKLSDACARLGVGRSKFYAMMAEGAVSRPVKLGGASRWPEADIDTAIARLIAARDGRKAA